VCSAGELAYVEVASSVAHGHFEFLGRGGDRSHTTLAGVGAHLLQHDERVMSEEAPQKEGEKVQSVRTCFVWASQMMIMLSVEPLTMYCPLGE